MANRKIRGNSAKANEQTISVEAWNSTRTAHERFKERVIQSPEAAAAFNKALAEIRERQLTLQKFRQARSLTQATIGELLEMDQSEVSRLEHRSDMLLSTLKRFVQAHGGELHLVVQFPDSAAVELLVGHESD